MNKRHSILALLLVLLNSCNSKTADKTTTANNDSIQKYIGLAGNDTLDFEKRIKYNDKALSFIDLEKNDSLTRENLNKLVCNYLDSKDWKNFKKYSNYYFEKVNAAKDTLGLARFYRYKGSFYCKNKVFDSAFYYLLKSEKLYNKTKDLKGIAKVNLAKAIVQNRLNDFLGAELSIKKAMFYFKDKNNFDLYACKTILGNIYQDLKEYDKAIINLEESIILIKKYNLQSFLNQSLLGTSLNNLGNAYKEQKNYSKAIYYFKLALREKHLLKKDPSLYGYLLNNLGHCYLKTKCDKTIPAFFYRADRIFDSLKIKDERSIISLNLSEYYLTAKDTAMAKKFADKALKFAKEANAPHFYLNALSYVGGLNKEKTSQYLKEYVLINDSLLFVERNARNQYYKIQLETDEISQEKETALKQRSLVLAIACSLLFITILIIIIARQRIKQKELRLKQTQQKANEELYQLLLDQKDSEEKARYLERKRIAMELHDGVMNKLTSTRLNLSVLSIKKDESTIEKCLGYIKDFNLVENEIRNITHNLNQEVFHSSNSFGKLLEDFVEEQNGINNTHFILEIDSAIDWNVISNVTKMNLYRIIQETVHNINKHAKAQKGIINLLIDQENICLSVIDDGVGIDFSEIGQGIGLKNIEHRVNQLRGKLHIHSKSNSGTSINISLPLEKAD